MKKHGFVFAASAMLMMIAAFLCISFSFGETRARCVNAAEWKAIYTSAEGISSDYLTPAGQTVLLGDWQLDSIATPRTETVSFVVPEGSVRGSIQCVSNWPDYLFVDTDVAEFDVDADGTSVEISFMPTVAAIERTEKLSVKVRVNWIPEGETDAALWADYMVTLLPVAGDTPEDPDSGDTPEDSDSGDTPEDSDSGETPEDPDSGETPEDSESGETTEDPDSGETTEDPDSGETPEDSDSGDTPEDSGSGETPEDSGSGETPEDSGSGETPEDSGSGETSENPDSGETEEPTEPETVETVEMEIVSEGSFVWEEQLAALVLVPQKAEKLVFTLNGGLFPKHTKYVADGQVYVLGDSMKISLPVSGGENKQIRFDFSALERPESGEIKIEVQTLYKDAVSGQGEIKATATRTPLEIDLTDVDTILNNKETITVPISQDTNGVALRLEMLTRTGAGIAFKESDDQFGIVLTVKERTVGEGTEKYIAISNADGKAPAGTYRLHVERRQTNQTVAEETFRFFVSY